MSFLKDALKIVTPRTYRCFDMIGVSNKQKLRQDNRMLTKHHMFFNFLRTI